MKNLRAFLSFVVLVSGSLAAAVSFAGEVERTLPLKTTVALETPKTYSFRFSIHDAAILGTELWSEEAAIRLTSKSLSHALGSVSPFGDATPSPLNFSEQYWVQVAYWNKGAWRTLGKRIKLVMAPYTLWSATAGSIAIECASGQFLVADETGEWGCGDPPSVQACESGDLLACYGGPAGTLGVGVCASGFRSCVSGAWGACAGAVLPSGDVCNGLDDDCDAASADGAEDPLNGTACDGADTDLCLEGTRSCAGGALVCGDVSGSAIDICNGSDDDCDAASADGAEDPLNGTACDGADTDLCLEGTRSCAGGALVCSDATGNNLEVCDGFDNDCDGAVDEGC